MRWFDTGNKGRRLRPFCYAQAEPRQLVLVLASSLFLSCAMAQPRTEQDPGRRMAPPEAVQCDRNLLTSYTGRVTGYRRKPNQLWLQISTDWDTVEELTVGLAEPDSAVGFQLNGTPMSESGWQEIEQSTGQLREGIRATAWVCADGVTPPLVNWMTQP